MSGCCHHKGQARQATHAMRGGPGAARRRRRRQAALTTSVIQGTVKALFIMGWCHSWRICAAGTGQRQGGGAGRGRAQQAGARACTRGAPSSSPQPMAQPRRRQQGAGSLIAEQSIPPAARLVRVAQALEQVGQGEEGGPHQAQHRQHLDPVSRAGGGAGVGSSRIGHSRRTAKRARVPAAAAGPHADGVCAARSPSAARPPARPRPPPSTRAPGCRWWASGSRSGRGRPPRAAR